MDEGFDLPIGGDLSGLQESLDAAFAAFSQMGAQIAASFEKINSVLGNMDGSLMKLAGSTQGLGTAQQTAATSAGALASHMERVLTAGANAGQTMQGVAVAVNLVSRANRILTGVNLGATLSGWISRAGGVRAAFSAIPAAMRAIANNPAFRRIAAGAALAVAGILAIRFASRTVSASLGALGRVASAVFRGMVSAARGAARAVGAAFKGIGGMMAIPAFPIAGLAGMAGAIGVAFASVGKAAEMETLGTAFAPLLGGADAAQARIAELAAFAAATPFELPEVATASRVLQTLTNGALATGAGLRLVGDVASGVNKPFDEIASTIGRLYDGLQSGRPVGEAMMRLQELGAISGETRGEIEKLQKSGAAGNDIWLVAAGALGRFGGSMERQSRTWNGLLSTLGDTISSVMASFGAPIIDGLKPWLEGAIANIEKLKRSAVAAGNSVRLAFDGAMAAFQTGNVGELIGAGLNLALIDGVNSFSAGIRGTVAFLGAALPKFMSAIADGLATSGILNVFKALAGALGSIISAAIMSTIGKITGWVGWEKDAQNERVLAGGQMALAKTQIESLDFGAGIKKAVDGFFDAVAVGKKASKDAAADPLLDRKPAAEKWKGLWGLVQKRLEENRAAADAAAKALDEKTKNSVPSKGLPESDGLMNRVNKHVAPAVMSMARIGGGGGSGPGKDHGQMFVRMIGENVKQTALLKKIAGQEPSGGSAARFA